ncbi:MAG: SUMF1/EgtB/PvdO family nonheme iron enzyme [Anaerolineales bacterium]
MMGTPRTASHLILLLILIASACSRADESSQPSPTDTSSVPQASPTPTYGIGSTWISPLDGMEMVYVPAGPFVMGLEDPEDLSRSHAIKLEPPQTVELLAFWIDKTELTNDMYTQCVDAGICEPPFEPAFPPYPNYYQNPIYGNHPVLGVTYENAERYCRWANRRLPTETEWEKAARGEEGNLYPWGDETPNCGRASYLTCSIGTLAVGTLVGGASPYGALDMAGNAWEWVADWYEPEAYSTPFPVEGKVFTETLHVVRGGSWTNDEFVLGSGVRFIGWPIDEISVGFGFRCVRKVGP